MNLYHVPDTTANINPEQKQIMQNEALHIVSLTVHL